MRMHVQHTVSRCFATLRQLRSIRRLVPTAIMQPPVVSLVLSRLDYGNAPLVGLPIFLQHRLSQCWTHLPGWSAIFVRPWPAIIGFVYRGTSSIRLRYSDVPHYMARRLNTCRKNWCASLTFHLVAGCGLLLRRSWWCHAIGSPPSAAVHSTLLVP